MNDEMRIRKIVDDLYAWKNKGVLVVKTGSAFLPTGGVFLPVTLSDDRYGIEPCLSLRWALYRKDDCVQGKVQVTKGGIGRVDRIMFRAKSGVFDIAGCVMPAYVAVGHDGHGGEITDERDGFVADFIECFDRKTGVEMAQRIPRGLSWDCAAHPVLPIFPNG
jgi:hypothetical protein